MSEYVIDLPNGGAADERIRLFHGAKMLYGYDLHERIVRCRDCKYAAIYHGEHESREPLFCAFHNMDVKPENFCSWGKTKGEQR